MEHGGHGTNYGKGGEGATDVQTQAMQNHQRTRKHKRAMRRQATATAIAEGQLRMEDLAKTHTVQSERVTALLETLLFICQSDAPIEMWVQLVRHLSKRPSLEGSLVAYLDSIGISLSKVSGISTDGAAVMVGATNGVVGRLRQRIPHVVSVHCIAHREALAARDAANALPELGIVDAIIRAVAELLGRSHNWHKMFKDLQKIFTATNLEMQGIHLVRWLSRGGAILRLVAVLPAVIVLLHLYDKPMYHIVTSYKFHFFLYFLADVHEELNSLNLLFQKREIDLTGVQSQVRRTIVFIRSRYVNCGPNFGTNSDRLSKFLERHASNRDVIVQGVDADGMERVHQFELHEEPLPNYTTARGDKASCTLTCRSYATELIYNVQLRLGDLERLNGSKLWMPRTWPRNTEARDEECAEHFDSVVELFHASDRVEILPGVDKRLARKELSTLVPVLAGVPKEEQPFHAGLAAILETSDWPRSYPNLVRLWVAVAVLPLSTVECERGFSRQNVIKSWNRTSLCNGKLEDLMCMSLLEYDMNWDRVIEVWRGMKKRRPRRAHQSEVRARKSAKGKEKVVVLSEEEHDDEARADDENSCSSSGFSSSDDEEDGGNF
ncbi:hypothetical protein CLOP_g15037 [Closterium sp. NIES-67]|nr:hypothetical protein CLOP_g15037 [Closterium sp. NIES-67]